MTTEELKALTVAKSVDARGTACPGPLLEAKKAIGTLHSNDGGNQGGYSEMVRQARS